MARASYADVRPNLHMHAIVYTGAAPRFHDHVSTIAYTRAYPHAIAHLHTCMSPPNALATLMCTCVYMRAYNPMSIYSYAYTPSNLPAVMSILASRVHLSDHKWTHARVHTTHNLPLPAHVLTNIPACAHVSAQMLACASARHKCLLIF